MLATAAGMRNAFDATAKEFGDPPETASDIAERLRAEQTGTTTEPATVIDTAIDDRRRAAEERAYMERGAQQREIQRRHGLA